MTDEFNEFKKRKQKEKVQKLTEMLIIACKASEKNPLLAIELFKKATKFVKDGKIK